ncbi:MAG: HAMP domain-containing sensor histidine kinase [Cyanobacteriota bacterium]|nr:HAMP domain-containing sensor histidine kinase [Cyanobacteriota bacterium]
MFESNGMLVSLSQILRSSEFASTNHGQQGEGSKSVSNETAQRKAEQEWRSAIAALECLLLNQGNGDGNRSCKGLILSAPAPVFSQPSLDRFHVGTFTPEAFHTLLEGKFQLPAAQTQNCSQRRAKVVEYPLFPVDPLAQEQFVVVMSEELAIAMVLGEDEENRPFFEFSFDPEIVTRAWETLRSRLRLTAPHQLPILDDLARQFAPKAPNYRIASQFARHLLDGQPEPTAPIYKNVAKRDRISPSIEPLQWSDEDQLPELELLQALTHEVRTPLTTIRMLARLLLKQRRNLASDAVERLETIDRECTEQIDRMELIFRAAELETTPSEQHSVQLVPIALEQVIQQNIAHWQKQARRRNVNLEILLPEKLPTIVSDPGMLDRVLRGVMESFTRSLPPGSQMRVQVTTAGHQLKLQLLSGNTSLAHSLKSMGQLLVFQPETGSLSLNWEVTKNLFNALGGKLIVRQRPQQGEELTVFLPLGNPQPDFAKGMFGKKAKRKK